MRTLQLRLRLLLRFRCESVLWLLSFRFRHAPDDGGSRDCVTFTDERGSCRQHAYGRPSSGAEAAGGVADVWAMLDRVSVTDGWLNGPAKAPEAPAPGAEGVCGMCGRWSGLYLGAAPGTWCQKSVVIKLYRPNRHHLTMAALLLSPALGACCTVHISLTIRPA